MSPHQIAQANATLIHDILTSTAGPGLDDMDSPPKVVLLAPPTIMETRESLPWGFQGAEERSKKLPALLSKVADLAGPHVSFFDIGSVAQCSGDGVHLDQDAQRPVADALATKCWEMLSERSEA